MKLITPKLLSISGKQIRNSYTAPSRIINSRRVLARRNRVACLALRDSGRLIRMFRVLRYFADVWHKEETVRHNRRACFQTAVVTYHVKLIVQFNHCEPKRMSWNKFPLRVILIGRRVGREGTPASGLRQRFEGPSSARGHFGMIIFSVAAHSRLKR